MRTYSNFFSYWKCVLLCVWPAQMHQTILRRGQDPLQSPKRCRECCSSFHCTFCKTAFADFYKVRYHIENHVSIAVKHEGMYALFQVSQVSSLLCVCVCVCVCPSPTQCLELYGPFCCLHVLAYHSFTNLQSYFHLPIWIFSNLCYVSFSFLLAINNKKFKASTFHKGVEIHALRAGMGFSLLCYFAWSITVHKTVYQICSFFHFRFCHHEMQPGQQGNSTFSLLLLSINYTLENGFH